MANDLNMCQFIGRLGRDPKVKHSQSGDAVANISIAVNSSWKDKDSGEKKEATTWVPVVFFGRLAEVVGEYLKKGSQVYVSGRFQVRKWQDKHGAERTTTEIVATDMQMLGSRDQSPDRNAPSTAQVETPDESTESVATADDSDGDIPFS